MYIVAQEAMQLGNIYNLLVYESFDKYHAATALFKSKRSTVARTTIGPLDRDTDQSSALARKKGILRH